MTQLEKIGWNDSIRDVETERVARVMIVQKNRYQISDGDTDYHGHLSGKFLNEAATPIDFPAVGDWVKVHRN
ncbi:ribosome biogenesis GTPase [Lentibacillus halodurans]|uniref:Ribosome biogenesis GTPase n=1 Tax=Lentibacillus halodurans TaxID=237679 RepID=A0A1I0XYT9_9BACI|nr:hypothetical protein [Lentibacillus halodurans]SFB05318.1 ribosome biogenesis GTPase [Lentibacillus halodurans]